MRTLWNKVKLPEILLLIFLLSLSNCTPVASGKVAKTDTPSASIQLLPKGTGIPFPTVVINTTQVHLVEQRCVKLVQDSPSELMGSLLLQTNKQGENPETYLLNLETGAQDLIGNLSDERVSPDGNKLAYRDLASQSVVIADANREKLKVISDPEISLYPADWLDNNRLLLNKKERETNGPYAIASLIVLNVATGEQKEWIPEYPNFNDHYNEVYWVPSSRIVVNPKFNYLIYPAWEDDLPVILWDIDSQSQIARVHDGDRVNTPQWSPDGKQFVISAPPQIVGDGITYRNTDDGLPYVGGNDLFLVSLTGEIRRLTYSTVGDEAWQAYYSWSPNGQYIAFLLQRGGFTGRTSGELSIVDISTGNVTDYCIKGIPIWSSDGRYVVVTQTDEKLQSRVMLVDLQTSYTWQIVENARAIGWVASPP